MSSDSITPAQVKGPSRQGNMTADRLSWAWEAEQKILETEGGGVYFAIDLKTKNAKKQRYRAEQVMLLIRTTLTAICKMEKDDGSKAGDDPKNSEKKAET